MLEVETYRRLAERALDRTIGGVDSPDAWFLKGAATARSLRQALIGHRFVGARRIGKLLLLDLDGGPSVGIRFGMTGTLVVDGLVGVDELRYAPGRRDPAWDRWTVRFQDGGSLVVQDPRRLGGVLLDPDVSHLGPDAMAISRAELAVILRGSRTALEGPAPRPVEGGRNRQSDRRRTALAGRSLPAPPFGLVDPQRDPTPSPAPGPDPLRPD